MYDNVSTPRYPADRTRGKVRGHAEVVRDLSLLRIFDRSGHRGRHSTEGTEGDPRCEERRRRPARSASYRSRRDGRDRG